MDTDFDSTDVDWEETARTLQSEVTRLNAALKAARRAPLPEDAERQAAMRTHAMRRHPTARGAWMALTTGSTEVPPTHVGRSEGASSHAPGRPTGTITIPTPHVPFGPQGVPENVADADYLRAAVRNIDHLNHGERIWGSNLTSTIKRLLLDAAAALDRAKTGPPSGDAGYPGSDW